MKRYLWLTCAVLCACATHQPAPVIDRMPAAKKTPSAPAAQKPSAPEKDWRPASYTVKKGDTLYSIGMEFGLDYKDVAQWNGIPAPYTIHVGQQLQLVAPKAAASAAPPAAPATPPPSAAVVTPLRVDALPDGKVLELPVPEPADATPLFSAPLAVKTPYAQHMAAAPGNAGSAAPRETKIAGGSGDDAVEWAWPVSGQILAAFNDGSGSKGVDIAGAAGQPVYAAAAGKVVYSGTGLRGYGKLVIIKHNPTYLSAYAHNSQLLVKEGQDIVRGQKIAEMGDTDTDRVKLHFEIRKLGKPIDPLGYLPAVSK